MRTILTRLYNTTERLNQPLLRSLAYLLVPVLCLYAFGLPLAADYYFARSQSGSGPDVERQAYNALQQAIKLSPGNDVLHRVYSQANLNLASSLGRAGNAADRETVSRLVAQGVREAKTAFDLNQSDWENASNAGLVYQNVVGFLPPDPKGGPDAKALAEQYLELAVKLDPFNPVRRLDLGGFYFNERNAEKALAGALKAAELKPDFANAHYSLAAVYKATGDIDKLKLELVETLKFLPADSPYRASVEQELKTIEAPTTK